ncbi:hypothetical protein, partial [uncultured Bacteroides sp.]|uniref:hypothetical protein n=1 Tax=uncultured Bacteroides sp. TaxID=162156 RepID=UPI00260837E4
YHVFINRNVKTKIFSCGHFYFIGCFSADKIVVAENRMITLEHVSFGTLSKLYWGNPNHCGNAESELY